MRHPDDPSNFPERMTGDLGASFNKLKTLIREEEYPHPHKHIPIEGGHLTVDPGASPELIDALKRMVEIARNNPDI